MDGKGFEVRKGECGFGVEKNYLLPHLRGKVGMGELIRLLPPPKSPPKVGEERED